MSELWLAFTSSSRPFMVDEMTYGWVVSILDDLLAGKYEPWMRMRLASNGSGWADDWAYNGLRWVGPGLTLC